ncbi:MAG: hypothetical protein M1826_006625 [Phylliscum demangeonii]|nr:MAG: hypothetical protein M1826_006625 [Phylliscum demangeonii]
MVCAVDAHTYSALFPEEWCLGNVPHGGFVASTFLRVASVHFQTALAKYNQPHTIILHLEYVRRTQVGPALFKVRHVKIGRQISTIQITLWQDNREEVTGYLTNSNMHTESGLSFPTAYTFDPHWKHLPSAFPSSRHMAKKVKSFYPRTGPTHPSWADEWLTLASGEKFTNESVGFVADIWTHPVDNYRRLEAQGAAVTLNQMAMLWPQQPDEVLRVFWYPTVVLNLDIKKRLPEEGVEWLFSRVRAKSIKNGRMDLEVVILDETGDIVALSHQGDTSTSSAGANGLASGTTEHGKEAGKAEREESSKHEENKGKPKPPGGYDETPVAKMPPGLTLRITFHRASSVPTADLHCLSSDPFVLAEITTAIPSRHREDPPLQFRTPTVRKNCNPVWNATWVVANVPRTGFRLKMRVFDEDPSDHDDRLGDADLDVSRLDEKWPDLQERELKLKKSWGSKRALLITACLAMASSNVHLMGTVTISVDVLGPTSGPGGKLYTIGPQYWMKHFSPMVGRIAGTKVPGKGGKAEHYDFEANQMQLQGPVPDELYHRYVEFRPFLRGMFRRRGLRGRLLNRALQHQHQRIYNYDRRTIYGQFASPSDAMTLQFLDMVHFDDGGRIFTYVLMLDGLLRFTETGKEFGIDLLSKHSMHSGVSVYVAWAGELFIRRHRGHVERPPHSSSDPTSASAPAAGHAPSDTPDTHPPAHMPGNPPDKGPPRDASKYELIIDNDSGTYRPTSQHRALLQRFLEKNLPGLYGIRVLACDDPHLEELKAQQRERKKSEGPNRTYIQHHVGRRHGSFSSVSSSDVADLEDRARGEPPPAESGDGSSTAHEPGASTSASASASALATESPSFAAPRAASKVEKGVHLVAEPRHFMQQQLARARHHDA